jgi:hypothetical protein
MILYSGITGYDYIIVNLLGDGESKVVDIDLIKPPYGLAFQNKYPQHWVIRMKDGAAPRLVSMAGNVLHMEWDEPLPPPAPDTMSPRVQLEFYMFYGSGSTVGQRAKETENRL